MWHHSILKTLHCDEEDVFITLISQHTIKMSAWRASDPLWLGTQKRLAFPFAHCHTLNTRWGWTGLRPAALPGAIRSCTVKVLHLQYNHHPPFSFPSAFLLGLLSVVWNVFLVLIEREREREGFHGYRSNSTVIIWDFEWRYKIWIIVLLLSLWSLYTKLQSGPLQSKRVTLVFSSVWG